MENQIDTMSVETDGVVWQDNYEEVVTYEEAISINDSFNISNGDDVNDNNETYETAVEDDSQYYSIVNETIVGDNDNSFIENISGVGLDNGDKTNCHGDIDETLVPKNVSEDCKVYEENKNILVNEEIVLYKIEGSNELYAVQFATDESGNLQKYQYQVRATEDGQFEAVPGTIELQPDTNNENIYKVNSETNYKSADHNNYEMNLQEHFITTILQEPTIPENMNEETNCAYENSNDFHSESELNESQIEQLESVDTSSGDNMRIENQEMKNLYEEGMYEEYLEDSDGNPSQSLPEYSNLKFFETENGVSYAEAVPLDELNVKITDQIKCNSIETDVEERFENVEPIIVRKSNNGTELHVLSEMIIPKSVKKSNQNSTFTKQILPKNDQISALNKFKANIISIVQDNGIVKKKVPAMTHVLNKGKTNNVFDNCDYDIKPVSATRNIINSKSNKKMTFLIVSRNTDPKLKEDIQRTPDLFKNSRSILKPTLNNIRKNNANMNYIRVEPKVYKDSAVHFSKVPNLCMARNITKDVLSEKVGPVFDDKLKLESNSVPKEPESKVSRQPRKQTIKPVDRVGSEIIIQPSEDDVEIITYDLEVSDGEYTPNKVKTRKRKVSKKRGKKPKTLEIILSDNEDNEEDLKTRQNKSRIIEDDIKLLDDEESVPKNEKKSSRSIVGGTANSKRISDDCNEPDNEADGCFVSDPERLTETENVSSQVKDLKSAESGLDLNNVMENVMSIMEEIHGEQDNDKHKMEIEVDVKEPEHSETDLLLLLENTNSPSVEEKVEQPEKRTEISALLKSESAELLTRASRADVDRVKLLRKNAEKNNALPENKTQWKCSKCPKSFPNEIALKTHSQVHKTRKRKYWQCEKCSKKFLFQRFYDNHMKTHEENKKSTNVSESSRIPIVDGSLTCDVCSKKFTSVSVFDAHKSFHRKRYKCNKCPQVFSTRSKQLVHSKSHSASRSTGLCRRNSLVIGTKSNLIYSTPANNRTPSQNAESSHKLFHCDICAKPFRQLSIMMIHREQHKMFCLNCGKKFQFKHLLDEHVRRHCLNSSNSKKKKRNSLVRSSLSRPALQKSNTDKKTICNICNRSFKTELACQAHVKSSHSKTPAKHLSRKFNDSDKHSNRPVIKQPENTSSFQKHKTLKRLLPNDKKTSFARDSKKENENCFSTSARNIKEKNTDSSESTTERRQSVRKQVPSQKVTALKCNLCDLSFSTHTGLFRHTRTHSENKHKCDHCDIVLETKDLLVSHIQSHMSSDFFDCETCSQHFSTKESLARHINKTNHKYSIEGRQTSAKKIKMLKRKIAHGGVPLSTKIQSFLVKRQKL